MKISSQNLELLETKFSGYLEGDLVDQFMEEYGIQFAAGHWCAGEFFDRFCPVGYNSDRAFDNTVPAQIERVARAGIRGIEFHDALFLDKKYQRDGSKIEEVKEALAHWNVVATNMNMNTWTDPKWKYGGITHPDAGIRRDCLALCLQGVEMARELGCVSCNLWPGSDGWDYHFEVDYGKRLDWYIEGCTEIARRCDALGLKFGTEPKQKEPREGNMIVNTVAKAALVAQEVNKNLGKTVMGVVIDYGHEQMVGNTPADSLYLLKRVGVPIANFHINGAKYNSNDEDRIAGTDDIWRLTEFCYAAIDTGYEGWFGEDQFTYRTEQVRSMRLSLEFFANCMKKALKIYRKREELARAQGTGDAGETIEVVKKILYNG
ncbi:MAG: sugar phosphate isomerase/epimerase [Fimbriimonadales bacterium]|nr:sugar phosphate isomerase/epimerase [Fimbriimonadales bacterium]